MSGFYGKYSNGGSQFIKHPSAIINRQKMKFIVQNSKHENGQEDVKKESIQISDKKQDDSEIKCSVKEANKIKALMVCKQNRYEKLSKDNMRRRKNQDKEKGAIKLSIKQMQCKIDELSEVIKKKVSNSTKEHEEGTKDSKMEMVMEEKNQKFNTKETIKGLCLIAGIILYSSILIILFDEQNSPANSIKFSMLKSTSRKSLIDYLFNV